MAEQNGANGLVWGPRVLIHLEEKYAPQRVEEFKVPPGGIDNLALHSGTFLQSPAVENSPLNSKAISALLVRMQQPRIGRPLKSELI